MQAANGWVAGIAGAPVLAFVNPLERFGVNWYDFTSQVVAFLIIAWILNRFVFRTVMKNMEERQKAIDEVAANRERIARELQAIEETRNDVLRKAHEEADQIVADTKALVAELLNQEKKRCERLGSELLVKAREDAELDRARLRTELKSEIATMIVNLTAKLTQMNLGAADRERMLQSAIQEISVMSQD
jgi:F-type H+-transporting ATPase subunit b